ncbi:MAG: histidine kinase [Spirosomataceae bacterium]
MLRQLSPKNQIVAAVISILLGISVLMRWYVFEVDIVTNLALMLVSGGVMIATWLFFSYLHSYLDQIFPYERGIMLRIAPQVLLSFGFLFLLTRLIFPLVVTHFNFASLINKQYTTLAQIAGYFAQFLIVVLLNVLHLTEYLFQKWHENATRAANLEKEKSQVQFDNLKNQLNPHFLFNSLTSLDSLIQDNPDLARQFLQQLSKVFRYVLQHKDKGAVPLYTELEFIKNYIFLLKIRFENTLEIDFQISEISLDKKITPVTLQILIENALKHNILSADRPLKIRICSDENYLKVENNLQLKKQVETSNRQGLQNLKNLYSFLTDKPFEAIEHNEKFVAYIPLID